MLAYWNSRSHPALQNIPYPEATSYDFASVASISVKCYKTAEGYEDTLHYSLSLSVGILIPPSCVPHLKFTLRDIAERAARVAAAAKDKPKHTIAITAVNRK